MIEVNTKITLDKFLDGKIKIYQPAQGYRAGIDAVLLAASIQADKTDHILEVGAGVGTVLLCLASYYPQVKITGLEVQPELKDLAYKNIEYNNYQKTVNVVHGDIASPPPEIHPNTYQQVISNPPYYTYGGNSAKHLSDISLNDWINYCLKMVCPRGYLTLIHRADQMDEILTSLKPKTGAIKIFPLWPRKNEPAKLVLIQARKGVKSKCTMLNGLVLHDENGAYTSKAEKLFRGQERLTF